MLITPLPIAGAVLLTTERRGDTRGSFGRWYGEDELGDWLGGQHIVQINHSFSARQGTVRGCIFSMRRKPNSKSCVASAARYGMCFSTCAVDRLPLCNGTPNCWMASMIGPC